MNGFLFVSILHDLCGFNISSASCWASFSGHNWALLRKSYGWLWGSGMEVAAGGSPPVKVKTPANTARP